MQTYFVAILLLCLGAVFSLLIKNPHKKLKFSSLVAVFSAIFAACSGVKALLFGTIEHTFHLGSIFQQVTFALDNLSAFFVIFISIMSSLAFVYSNGYLAPYIEKGKDISAHCVFLLMLMASMLGVVTIQNSLMFLIIWELMSLSSFFLVIFEHEKKEVMQAGIKYLVYMHVSVIFIILLFVFLSTSASSLNFVSYKDFLSQNMQYANLIFLLAFFGFGIKAGFFPFHNWLPVAHPSAPSHVSAVMSGVMIKTGIYGILRILSFGAIPSKSIIFAILFITVVTALYGISYATVQKDIKKMLAYSSIENIGIMGIGISIYMLATSFNQPLIALLGLAGALIHVVNHSIFKELLFMGAGSVYIKTHTRDMEVLGGLIKSMPKTALCFVVGGIAICALPPFNGFVSEFLIYLSFIKSLAIHNIGVFIAILGAFSGLALVGTMAILCFTKTISITFLAAPKSEHAINVKEDCPKVMTSTMKFLATLCLLIGLFPQYAFIYALKPASVLMDLSKIDVNSQFEFLNNLSMFIIGLALLILALYFIKKMFAKKSSIHTAWGCGYNKLTSRVQYSAASYIHPLLTIAKPLFKRSRDVKKAKGIFPTETHYRTKIDDIEEVYVINPLIKLDEKFLSKFEKIQNGDIQQYIRFGLMFLAIILVIAVFLG